MKRTLSLAAALVLGLTLPVAAKDAAVDAPDTKTQAVPAAKANLFTEEQARVHLAHQGYTDISELAKDQNGVWRGSATRNGKTVTVAVDIKGAVNTN